VTPKHFLFVSGALPERSSSESAEIQLRHDLWGLRSNLIRGNLSQYLTLTGESRGLVYVLKAGICAEFAILSNLFSFQDLDEFLRDELRAETRYGFIRVGLVRRWDSSSEKSFSLLQQVLEVPDKNELTRRLNLGMHGLTQDQYVALVGGLS